MLPIPILAFPLKGKECYGRQPLEIVVDQIEQETTEIKQIKTSLPFKGRPGVEMDDVRRGMRTVRKEYSQAGR